MINRTTTHQFPNITFQDTGKHYVLPVKKEMQVKTTRKAYKALFAYRENPFEQTLKLKKSIHHHSLLNLFFPNI